MRLGDAYLIRARRRWSAFLPARDRRRRGGAALADDLLSKSEKPTIQLSRLNGVQKQKNGSGEQMRAAARPYIAVQ
jgi:hypothetical protein